MTGDAVMHEVLRSLSVIIHQNHPWAHSSSISLSFIMSRNYSELMKEPSLAEKFLKAFWGEKMMAAILTCQQPNMMLQRCLMAKNNDIMQCQQEATEVEHCAPFRSHLSRDLNPIFDLLNSTPSPPDLIILILFKFTIIYFRGLDEYLSHLSPTSRHLERRLPR